MLLGPVSGGTHKTRHIMESISEMEEKLRLTSLPPEVCEHIISMLPSMSLHNLPTISSDFASMAAREMEHRHNKMDKKVNIFQYHVIPLLLTC